jgi:hypothetical protein
MLAACQTAEQDQSADPSAQLTEIDSISGLVIDENFELVRGQCTACHSAKLITQNSATREGWEQMIRWMQRDQGLWDLGTNEPLILDYLSEHYGIKQQGRRAPLTNIEWYSLTERP